MDGVSLLVFLTFYLGLLWVCILFLVVGFVVSMVPILFSSGRIWVCWRLVSVFLLVVCRGFLGRAGMLSCWCWRGAVWVVDCCFVGMCVRRWVGVMFGYWSLVVRLFWCIWEFSDVLLVWLVGRFRVSLLSGASRCVCFVWVVARRVLCRCLEV